MVAEKLADTQRWLQEDFGPWVAKARAYAAEKEQNMGKFRQNRVQLQQMIGLLMDGKAQEAVKLWNALELKPVLQAVVLDDANESITMQTAAGKQVTLSLDDLIAAVQSDIQTDD